MSSGQNLAGLAKIFGTQNDPKLPLPFLQLGDIFSKEVDDEVFIVMNASCNLQFVPEEISRSRIPDRNDTILLMPGSICLPNECDDKALSTGLIKICDKWRAIVWNPSKLTGVPHCLIRPLLQDAQYDHSLRLRTARALELQQQVFHHASRIGLEVQPPLTNELDIQVFARKGEGFVQSGETIKRGIIRFHTPRASVLVLKQASIDELCNRLEGALLGDENSKEGKKLSQLIEKININASALSRTPLFVPEAEKVKTLKAADRFPKIVIDGLALVFREPSQPDETWAKSHSAIVSIGNAK